MGGPSGERQGRCDSRGAGHGRAKGAVGGCSEEWHVSAQDSSDEEDTIHTDLMGADEEENIDNSITQKKEKEDDRRMWRHKRKNLR